MTSYKFGDVVLIDFSAYTTRHQKRLHHSLSLSIRFLQEVGQINP